VKLLLASVVAAALVVSACGAAQETKSGRFDSEHRARCAATRHRPGGLPSRRSAPIETPAVKPRRDGVHLRVVNETGMDLDFSIEDPSEGGMGTGAPPGRSPHVADLHPGTVSISCYDAYTEDGSEVAQASLEIVDEDGIWVSTRLQCESEFAFSQNIGHVSGARGKSDPLAAAKEPLEGYMQEGDVVEPAGYPDTPERIYCLVRAGNVLATVSLWRTGPAAGCRTPSPAARSSNNKSS
jgi:hypothetical protein